MHPGEASNRFRELKSILRLLGTESRVAGALAPMSQPTGMWVDGLSKMHGSVLGLSATCRPAKGRGRSLVEWPTMPEKANKKDKGCAERPIYAWTHPNSADKALALFPKAEWKEATPGFKTLSAGTNNPADDRTLGDYVARQWYSEALVDKKARPDLATAMEALRNSPDTMRQTREASLDLENAPRLVQKIIDAMLPVGIESYRVQNISQQIEIEPGTELALALSPVSFSPEETAQFEKFHEKGEGADKKQARKKVWFKFPANAPGIIYDDSDKSGRKESFRQAPVEALVRGKFIVTGQSVANIAGGATGKSFEREVYNLEFVGPMPDTRQETPTSPIVSELVGNITPEARQRMQAARNEIRGKRANTDRDVGYRASKDADLPVMPGSEEHIKKAVEHHRTLFGYKDTDMLSAALLSNKDMGEMSPFERAGKIRDRNIAMRHLAISAITHRLALLLDGDASPQLSMANKPDQSRYYRTVRKAIEEWNLGSGSGSGSDAIRRAVAKIFDTEEMETKQGPADNEEPRGQDNEDIGLQAVVLAIYQTTQEALGQKDGLVRLYRGMRWGKETARGPAETPPEWAYVSNVSEAALPPLKPSEKDYAAYGELALKVGEEKMVPAKPMDSFSTNVAEAVEYAFGETRLGGTIVETAVPVGHIFSTPSTGFGNPGKSEVLVIGGQYPSRVISRRLPNRGSENVQ